MICAPDRLREELVAWQEDLAESDEVIWYRWGGYEAPADGHDCSGHIVWALGKVGIQLPKGRAWADSMFRDLPATEEPLPGDLALYGTKERATHVMMVLGPGDKPGIYRVGGMTGGGSRTTSEEIARKQGARHRIHASHLYRRDFLGFRRIPA